MIGWANKFMIRTILILCCLYAVIVALGCLVGYIWLLKTYTLATIIFTILFLIYILFEDRFNPHVRIPKITTNE